MRVSFSPRALRQIEEVSSPIAADNPTAAAAWVRRVEALTSLLGTRPYMGRPTDRAGFRAISARSSTVLGQAEEVRIVRIRHTAQRPE
jgi:plasmid stabilization system protein ParE